MCWSHKSCIIKTTGLPSSLPYRGTARSLQALTVGIAFSLRETEESAQACDLRGCRNTWELSRLDMSQMGNKHEIGWRYQSHAVS